LFRIEKNKEVIVLITNVYASAFFVILAVVVFILLCFKGMHTGIAALIATVIAAFGSADTLATSLFTTFPSGVGSLVTMMFFVFTASGLFATLMEKTGCAMSVGKTMVKWLGVDRSWMAISATTVILLFAGVGTYTYVIVVLALPLMKAANLPKKIGMIAGLGIATDVSFCFPVANVPGSLPNGILGTTIFSAPVLSCVTGVLGVIMFVLWMIHMVKKARRDGQGYDGPEDVGEVDTDTSDLPSFVTSVIPLLVVVIAAMAMAMFSITGADGTKIDFATLTGINATSQVAVAQFCGCLAVLILHFGRCKKAGILKMVSEGAPSMWGFLVLAGCVYGFGQVVTNTAFVQPLTQAVLGLNASPYISAMISVAVIAGLCTDGISAMMVWLPMFGQAYLDMGVDPGALRRLLLCTSQTFDSMPHAQSTAITLGVYGLTHKQAYWDMFVTTVIFPVIFSVFCCICCIIFYPV
jgi:H+/gluconate symporter-like permease